MIIDTLIRAMREARRYADIARYVMFFMPLDAAVFFTPGTTQPLLRRYHDEIDFSAD